MYSKILLKMRTRSVCHAFAALIAAILIASSASSLAQIHSGTNAVTELGLNTGPRASNKSGPVAAPTNYILKANDEIQIQVFRNADLDGVRRVSKDGTIDFPLIGIVNVAGKTTYEAAAQLATLLDKDYLVRPQVSVMVMSIAKRYFNVFGEVNAPGIREFPDDRDLDILGAITLAGGFTKNASQVNIMVKRIVEGRDRLFKVDAARMVKERDTPLFLIQPNDIIFVKEQLMTFVK
jgi:protein involved in polysaccharide export with SLBB domain